MLLQPGPAQLPPWLVPLWARRVQPLLVENVPGLWRWAGEGPAALYFRQLSVAGPHPHAKLVALDAAGQGRLAESCQLLLLGQGFGRVGRVGRLGD